MRAGRRRAPPRPPARGGRRVTRKRLALGATAASLTAVALLLGGVLRTSSQPGQAVAAGVPAPSAETAAGQLDAGISPQDTNGMISRLQAALTVDPNDVNKLDLLGLEYQQAARETGDPAYY